MVREGDGVGVFQNCQRSLIDREIRFRDGGRFGESGGGSSGDHWLQLVEVDFVAATCTLGSLDLHELPKALERLGFDAQLKRQLVIGEESTERVGAE